MILFIVLLLAFSYPVPCTASGQLFAREAGTADQGFPEPCVFHNLTRDEFAVKVLDYYAEYLLKRTVTDSAGDTAHHNTLTGHQNGRCVPYSNEKANNAAQQAVVQQRNEDCANGFGSQYQFISGNCERENSLDFYYNLVPDGLKRTRKHRSKRCLDTVPKK